MFGKLFGNPDEGRIFRRVVAQTAEGLLAAGMERRQADKMARELVTSIRDGMLGAGSSKASLYEEGRGDQYLAQEGENDVLRERLKARRRHGATDQDIRRWHNLSPLEQKVLLKTDEWLFTSTFQAAQDEGRSAKEADDLAARAHARYTENAELIGQEGYEDLLPAELKLRVNEHRDRELKMNPQAFTAAVERAGDLNAYVRQRLAENAL